MKRFILVAAVPLIFGLTACGAPDSSSFDEPEKPKDDNSYSRIEPDGDVTKLYIAPNYRDAYMFNLNDTVCIMATNEKAVALSCDWTGGTVE